jgi:SM-20-related protein
LGIALKLRARHLVIPSFLGAAVCEQLRSELVRRESQFGVPQVGGIVASTNTNARNSLLLSDVVEFCSVFTAAIKSALPFIERELGVNPLVSYDLELEAARYGNAGFYKKHVDTFTGADRTRGFDRVLSCVYYMHSQPKRFSGGALRLYPLAPGTDGRDCIDIAPANDTLAVFSSWQPHEVLPVASDQHDFESGRFSINCWILRVLKAELGNSTPQSGSTSVKAE